MRIQDLIDQTELAQMIASGMVGVQHHPTEPLTILNYTKKAQYDGAWNDTTRQCRGLIVNKITDEVVARPWPKFHNYGEHDTEGWDPDEVCFVTDKMDGSLGVLYPLEAGGHAVATRGSFTSDQAIFATKMFAERHAHSLVMPGITYLFEIIYPANRVVVNYDDMEDLVLLGGVVNEDGATHQAATLGWDGTRVRNFGWMTLREALEMEPRPNAEGVVLHLHDQKIMIKLKQDDYVALHRIISGLNEKNVWEHLAVDECSGLIFAPEHWASYLGIDPRDAQQYQASGPGWRESIPEEFQKWLGETSESIYKTAVDTLTSSLDLAAKASKIEDRRERYEMVKHHPCAKEIMRYIGDENSHPLMLRAWREARPESTRAVFDREEDVA